MAPSASKMSAPDGHGKDGWSEHRNTPANSKVCVTETVAEDEVMSSLLKSIRSA